MLDSFSKLLNGEQPEKIVWTADISYWIAARQQDGTADPSWKTEEGYLRLHAELGIMPYYYYDKFWVADPVYDDTIFLNTISNGNLSERVLETPFGTLREESAFMPESCCHGITQHMVTTPEDMDVLLYILEHRKLRPTNLDNYRSRTEMWKPYNGIPCLAMPRSPLSALCYEWIGIQNLVYLFMDCSDKIKKAMRLLEEQEEPILTAVCELAPSLVHFPDNLSSDNLTSYYDDYMREGHQRRIERLHASGVKCAVHLDGTVKGLLPKLTDCGFDAIEALTPQPGGDLPVSEMRNVADNEKVILWGGVPGIMFAPSYTWQNMKSHVEHVIDCWEGQPFILGVADQVPPDGDIEMVRKISELIKKAR